MKPSRRRAQVAAPRAARREAHPDRSDEPERAPADLTSVVGDNLRRLRKQKDWSLERLAQLSGVSRAMLGQIELGQSTPTINVLWKIAGALGVPFSTLLRQPGDTGTRVMTASRARFMTSADGAFRSRALFPAGEARSAEFYELRLAPRSVENAEAHAPGTKENLMVASGKLDIAIGTELHNLGAGDAILFEADVPHTYTNPGDDETVMYLVMTYAERGA